MTGYCNLANAIVIQAVNDWSNAVKTINRLEKLKKPMTPKQKEKLAFAKGRKAECEEFFLGGWFSMLTDCDGSALLRDLKANKLPNQARRRRYSKKED